MGEVQVLLNFVLVVFTPSIVTPMILQDILKVSKIYWSSIEVLILSVVLRSVLQTPSRAATDEQRPTLCWLMLSISTESLWGESQAQVLAHHLAS